MKTSINHRKVKQRAMLANLASMGGLLILLSGVVVPLFLPELATVAQFFMVVGMGVSMVGIYLANRWVRKPRPEYSLEEALKSLNDSYHLFHYPSLPCEHVILSPCGVMVIEVFNLAGDFFYQNGRWKEKMNVGRALRYIVEEHLGNPTRNAMDLKEYLRGRFEQAFGADKSIPISTVVTFTHPATRLEIKGAPMPVCKVDKLRRCIQTKTPRLDPELYEQVNSFLEKLTIT